MADSRIKSVFSNYTATPQGVFNQVNVLLEDGTICVYSPTSVANGKATYGWLRIPVIPQDLSTIPFLGAQQ